jgi:site-specific recombinase XerD
MIKAPRALGNNIWRFPGESDSPFLGTSLNHQHSKVRDLLGLSKDFVIHSLRHTMLRRLGEAGVDAFTIMRIAGHSSITVSQRYVHPSPEALERAFERLESLNATAGRRGAEMLEVATFPATVGLLPDEEAPLSVS